MKFLFPLLLILSLSISAQTEILIKGQITNDVSDKDFISVINVSLKEGTITDKNGAFEILAQENDILDISALQFRNKKFIVTKQMIVRGFISIELEPETFVLPEMKLSTSTLSGNLSKDVEDSNTGPSFEKKILRGEPRRILTPAERRLYTATTRGERVSNGRAGDLRFDIPLNAVLNAVSGETKRINTLIDKEKTIKQIVSIENKFAPDFFTDALEIEVSKIEDFLFYAQAVNEKVFNYHNYNDLVLVEELVKEAPKYKRLGKEDLNQKD